MARSLASAEDLEKLTELIEQILTRTELDRKRWDKRFRDLDERLLAIENSRILRLLRWPGRLLLDWRGRLGQALLHSPLHPVYLKLVRPRGAVELYQRWVATERPPEERPLGRRPVISVILPVHNPAREWLDAAVDSLLGQTYTDWQLCASDDGSSDPWVAERLAARAAADPRIRFVRCAESQGISAASNRAGELARGDYVGFLDQDDTLAPWALYSIAEALQDGEPDILYSDEDYLDERGSRVQPIFKPAFSPDLLRCCMYFGHFLVVRKAKLDKAGWLRSAFDGAQDYDLALRLTAETASVRHIPRVLYHWRRHPASTASSPKAKPASHAAGFRALSEAASQQDAAAVVESGPAPNTYRVRWPSPAALRVSLVVCSRKAELLARCLRAVERNTAYENREIVVVQHRTGDTARMDRLLERTRCLWTSHTGPFNFSLMNNLGARQAGGEILVFLNDDVEPLTPDWLHELLAHARRPEVGVAGARLLYPTGAIQHAGLTIGIMNGVGHLHRDTYSAQFWNWLPFTRNVSAVTGACLAIRKGVFEELGGFDEAFPVNYGDADLCLRARQAGYEVLIEPAATLRHYECRTRGPGVSLEERERWQERWAEWLEADDPFYTPHLTTKREDASLEL